MCKIIYLAWENNHKIICFQKHTHTHTLQTWYILEINCPPHLCNKFHPACFCSLHFDRLFMWHQFCNILYREIRKIIQPSSCGWANLFLYLIIGCTKHTASDADVLCLFAVFHPSSTGVWIISRSRDSHRHKGCSLSIGRGVCCAVRALAGREALLSWEQLCVFTSALFAGRVQASSPTA